MKFSWREGDERVVGSSRELEDLLGEADASAGESLPMGVLTAESGGELHIGLCHPSLAVLLYFPPEYEGEGSMHGVGDVEKRDRDEYEPPLTFFLFTHHSEFPRWMGIPKEQALQAMQQFLRTDGLLPPGIHWELD